MTGRPRVGNTARRSTRAARAETMHLGLYEISLSGHHGGYVKAISRAAIRLGWKVTLLTPERESNHPMFKELSSILGSENIATTPHSCMPWAGGGKIKLLAHHFEQHRAAARSLQLIEDRCDFIYTSNLGCLDKAMLLLGSPSRKRPIGGMCMRVRFHMPFTEGKASRHSLPVAFGDLQLRRLASISGVTTADLPLFEFCQSQKGSLQNIKYVPEIGMEPPAIGRSEARRQLGIDEGGQVILIYGALTQKKALPELVSALAAVPRERRVTVLAVGKIDDWMTRYLATTKARQSVEQLRLIIHAGFADEAREAAAFAAADAVWVAYNDPGSMSGVFFQAVCSGLPVIAPNHGVLRWLTQRYRVGVCVDRRNAVETMNVILDLLSDRDALDTFRANAEAIAGRHVPASFGEGVCSAVREWLGRTPHS